MADDRNNDRVNNDNNRSGRGFAGMDEAKQKEIASKGGRAAHEKGTAHEFDSEEARAAGRKGGLNRGQNQGGTQGGGSEEVNR